MNENFEELANAIIMMAVKDWRWAVQMQKKHPRYKPARQRREECERFFLSEWFENLTDVDGSFLLRKLKTEVEIDDE